MAMHNIDVDGAVQRITEKMEWVSERSKDKIPYKTVNGVHDDLSRSDINWWTNGFWPGIQWLLYHETGSQKHADIAREAERKLDRCFEEYYGIHHDAGFMWLLSAAADYRLTGDPLARKRALHAANLLAGRFNPAGNFIRAWNGTDNSGWAIIDCMMNLALLYWASEETGDHRFREIAMRHADMAAKCFVRPDGSVKHIVVFDPVSGEMLEELGGQGYAKGTSWTRGQAWGLYGFMISWKHTNRKVYLETAKKIADYFISQIPESGLIPVDFCQPETPRLEDSMAAAIAAGGMIELSRELGEDGEQYLDAAKKMLDALLTERCCWTKDSDGILERCTAAYHNQEKETNIIYGDYFLIEAVLKLKGNDVFLW